VDLKETAALRAGRTTGAAILGCERHFARRDHKGGLLWLLNGGKIIELQRDRAIIETERGSRQSYRRRPVEVGRIVLDWELKP
jgi:hypothetical protein